MSLGLAVTAVATPGSPGTPGTAAPIFTESFEQSPTPTPVPLLTQITGPAGMTYTADPAWLSNCNGFIASEAESSTDAGAVASCGSRAFWDESQQLAYVLGIGAGETPAQAAANYALTAFTSASPGAGLVQFRTSSQIPLSGTARFLVFAADVAAFSCGVSAPLLQFSLVHADGTTQAAGGQVNGCVGGRSITAPAFAAAGAQTASVQTVRSPGAILFTGASAGIQLVNNNGSANGNDAAIDNVQLVDATPQLDKTFTPATITRGGVSTLTFTVTNTSELDAKAGWSFADSLPAGLTVASGPGATTTCPATTVTASVGGSSVAVPSGTLAQGQSSCTITVPVTSTLTGSFTNGPANLTLSALDPPNPSTLTVVPVPATVAVSTITTNGVGSFAVTGTNGFTPQTITTTAAGAVVAAPEESLTAIGAATVLTEAPQPGWELTAATCQGLGSGGTATADLAAGTITLDAAATAEGSTIVCRFENTASPMLSTTKTVQTSPITVGIPNSYTIAASNAGPGSTTALAVLTDPMPAGLTIGTLPPDCAQAGPTVTCTIPPGLSPGAQASFVIPFTATTAAGLSATNGVTITGGGDSTCPGAARCTSTVLTPISDDPGIILTKTADTSGLHNPARVGDVIIYHLSETNVGNVTLDNVSITDPMPRLSALTDTWPGVPGTLLPTQAVTATASYTLTQADLDAGALTNTATGSADPPTGTPISAPTPGIITPLAQAPALTLVKTATPAHLTIAGAQVSYSFRITNTGNVTLTSGTVTETAFTGTGPRPAAFCPSTAAILVPTATVTCTAVYTVTQSDINTGVIANTATASATSPIGVSITSTPSTATITTTLKSAPALTTLPGGELAATGQQITGDFLLALTLTALGSALILKSRRRKT